MGKSQRDIVSSLRRRYGNTFVAEVMLDKERNSIGDEWTLWGTVDVVRAIYNYLKAGFNSLSIYINKISWQEVMAYTDMKSLPAMRLVELISRLTETVSTNAKQLACEFIEQITEFFNFIFGIAEHSETVRDIDRSTMDNVRALRREVENCVNYLDRLGEKAIEFIQWIAKKMYSIVETSLTAVYRIFEWAGEITASLAEYGASDAVSGLKSVGKFALRVGVFTFSVVYQHSGEAQQSAAGVGAKWFRNVRDFFSALLSSIKSTPAVAASLELLSQVSDFAVSYFGAERVEQLKSNISQLFDMVLQALETLIGWLMKLDRLPGLILEKVLSPFLGPL